MTRRGFIAGATAMAMGMVALASPVRSMVGAKHINAAQTAWTNPYITDGLVAMWDGEWNVGGGEHDANAISWVDLSGNHSLSTLGESDFFGDKYYAHRTKDVMSCVANDFAQAVLDKTATVELVFQNTQAVQDSAPFGLVVSANSSARRGWWIWQQGMGVFQDFRIRQAIGGTSFLQSLNISWNDLHSYSFIDTAVYLDGVSTGLNAQDGTTMDIGNVIQIGRLGGYNYWWGNIYSIRIYNRALTAEEIAHNYAIDKARFNLP